MGKWIVNNLILEKGLDSVTIVKEQNISLYYELLHNDIQNAHRHNLTDTLKSFPILDPNESSPSYL